MKYFNGRWRWCAALAALLAGCNMSVAGAQTAELQIAPEDRSWVTLGDGAAQIYNARQVAAHYLSYAILAGRAYDTLDARDPKNPKLTNSTIDEKYWPKTFARIGDRAFVLRGQRWTLLGGQEGRTCASGNPDCRNLFDGLGVHFWKRHAHVRGGRCSEVVIAFRGTTGLFDGSMASNLNPLAPVLILFRIMQPNADYYFQVRTNIDNWVKTLEEVSCVGARTKFVAVGHSLGGGLAQHAAYQNPRISKVYTFNTSPVTAWSSVDQRRRDVNVKGLEVDHVVEQGEGLAAVRLVPGLIWGRRTCDPQERTIHFDASSGGPGSEHKIWPLAQRLYTWSGTQTVRKRTQRAAELPSAKLDDKIANRCITEPREEFLARVAAEREASPISPSVRVRPTPAALRVQRSAER